MIKTRHSYRHIVRATFLNLKYPSINLIPFECPILPLCDANTIYTIVTVVNRINTFMSINEQRNAYTANQIHVYT